MSANTVRCTPVRLPPYNRYHYPLTPDLTVNVYDPRFPIREELEDDDNGDEYTPLEIVGCPKRATIVISWWSEVYAMTLMGGTGMRRCRTGSIYKRMSRLV